MLSRALSGTLRLIAVGPLLTLRAPGDVALLHTALVYWPCTSNQQYVLDMHLAQSTNADEPQRGDQFSRPERFTTGIDGLDTILRGGLLTGGVYIIMGPPGAGKTILANQVCFHHATSGGRAVYITLLAEAHSAMVHHMKSLSFFDMDRLSNGVAYYSGYSALDEDGLTGLLELMQNVLREERPTMLVFDGMATIESMAPSDLDFKRFIHQIQLLCASHSCTCFLLTHLADGGHPHPEHTMVDGIVELQDRMIGVRPVREIRVRKLRGSDHIRGRHIFEITNRGVVVHPRTEAVYCQPHLDPFEPGVRIRFGIEALDEMLGGGLHLGTTTMVIGNVGSGKTLLGLHFLAAGAENNEPGLHFGLSEPPSEIIAKANMAGLDFSGHVHAGRVRVIWQPPFESFLDKITEQLLKEVEERGIRRLFIDGLQGLKQLAIQPERLPTFFSALANELRARHVTTLFSTETRSIAFREPAILPDEVASIAGTTIYLRQIEIRSQNYRLISVAKMRHGTYDPNIHEFTIGSDGIKVASTNDSAERILAQE